MTIYKTIYLGQATGCKQKFSKGTSLTERLLQKSECITVTNWTPNGWQQDLDFTEVISDIQTKVTLGSEKHFQRVPGRIFQTGSSD